MARNVRSVGRMLPIAAPAIAAPAVAPASASLAEGILPGNSTAGSPATAGAAVQPGGDPSIFALLLTPPVDAEIPVNPAVIPGEVVNQSDTGLAQLLSAFLGDAPEPAADASDDGELLALLASFGAAALPAQPVPSVTGGAIDDVLGLPLTTCPAGPAPAATAEPPALAKPTVSAAMPMMPAGDALAAVPSTKLPPTPPVETVAIPAAPEQRVLPVATSPSASAPLPLAIPALATGVATEAAQSTATVPAAPILAAVSVVADASRKPTPLPSNRAQVLPQTAIGAAPVAEADPTTVAAALQGTEPVRPAATMADIPQQTAAQTAEPMAVQTAEPMVVQTAEPKAMPPTVADAVPAATPAPEPPVMGRPAAVPPVASALPATAPLPAPALTPRALVQQEVEPAAAAVPEAPHAAPAATASPAVTVDGSSLAIAAAPRAEPFAAVLRSEAAQPATGRSEPNPLERAVAHQVSRAIVQHLPDGGARMVMRLTPPELGTVRIEFISRDGMVTARLMAEDEGVRQALDRALPHIRAEVRSDHPTIDISVDRSDQRQAWGDGHARHEHRDDPRSGQGRRPREGDPVFTVDGAEPTALATPVRAAQQLGGRVGPTLVDALA